MRSSRRAVAASRCADSSAIFRRADPSSRSLEHDAGGAIAESSCALERLQPSSFEPWETCRPASESDFRFSRWQRAARLCMALRLAGWISTRRSQRAPSARAESGQEWTIGYTARDRAHRHGDAARAERASASTTSGDYEPRARARETQSCELGLGRSFSPEGLVVDSTSRKLRSSLTKRVADCKHGF